ncbi:CBS domain-containing protein CBSX1 [Hibiscus syriacus]|uniref:CBS domain-containing protein CBSX1 n=1 Tax=Hibiscus syriacus TaxID=106335 RepID=A0A6A2Y967_HIBSY|nr:CBS domain-containing protein CBSX1 [Hibiscus syriacus]
MASISLANCQTLNQSLLSNLSSTPSNPALSPCTIIPTRLYLHCLFQNPKEALFATTSVDEALEALVERRVTGFPVIDDDWNLVGVVSDYDLLALDSISEIDEQKHGKVVGDLMTPSPLVVRETTNLEDAARLLLETKYRRLPVVDGDGKLVGIITRGNVVRAALHIKRSSER